MSYDCRRILDSMRTKLFLILMSLRSIFKLISKSSAKRIVRLLDCYGKEKNYPAPRHRLPNDKAVR
jgi:hypothetical protein